MAAVAKFQQGKVKKIPYTVLLPVANQPFRETSTANRTVTTLQFITTSFFLMVSGCTIIILMTFCAAQQKPIFKLNSLSVSNLTVSKTKLVAIWAADFTIANPNVASELSFEGIDSIIFYEENDPLSTASVEGFEISSNGKNDVQMKFETTGYEGDQPIVEYPILREIEENRKNGTLRFTIRMSLWVTYKTGFKWVSWRRRVLMNSICFDLNVGVKGENGRLIAGGQRYCNIIVVMPSDG